MGGAFFFQEAAELIDRTCWAKGTSSSWTLRSSAKDSRIPSQADTKRAKVENNILLLKDAC